MFMCVWCVRSCAHIYVLTCNPRVENANRKAGAVSHFAVRANIEDVCTCLCWQIVHPLV